MSEYRIETDSYTHGHIAVYHDSLIRPSFFGVWGSRYIETHLFTNQNMGIVWATLVCGFNHIILFHPGAEVGFTKMPVNNPGYFMANVCTAVCMAVACRSIVLTSSYFIPCPLFLPGSVLWASPVPIGVWVELSPNRIFGILSDRF